MTQTDFGQQQHNVQQAMQGSNPLNFEQAVEDTRRQQQEINEQLMNVATSVARYAVRQKPSAASHGAEIVSTTYQTLQQAITAVVNSIDPQSGKPRIAQSSPFGNNQQNWQQAELQAWRRLAQLNGQSGSNGGRRRSRRRSQQPLFA